MDKKINVRHLQRKGTEAEWNSEGAVKLLNGELGYATDTKILKMGDGEHLWKDLYSIANGSGGGVPVGAIFTTPRTGTIPGAVEANGGSYNLADYSGEGSIGALLTAGSIAYVSKAAFQTQVANTGACDSFGWNGATKSLYAWKRDTKLIYTDTSTPTTSSELFAADGTSSGRMEWIIEVASDYSTIKTTTERDQYYTYTRTPASDIAGTTDPTFLVPHLREIENTPHYDTPTKITAFPYTAPQNGWIVMMITRSYNNNEWGHVTINGVNVGSIAPATNTSYGDGNVQIPVKAGDVLSLSGNVTKSFANFYPYPTKSASTRYMVQLATGATDQALETCTSVLADVSALNAHRVIEFQAPTESNSYTWYRKYADGWVEQGGYIASDTNSYTAKPITLPVPMVSGNYQVQKTTHKGASSTVSSEWGWWGDTLSSAPDNTSTIVYLSVASTSFCFGVYWQVSGMAA